VQQLCNGKDKKKALENTVLFTKKPFKNNGWCLGRESNPHARYERSDGF
jgi:hypothetical protein